MIVNAFLSSPKSCLEESLKILSVICWGFGGCMYVFNTYEAVEWTLIFPNPNELTIAVWSMNLALRFMCLWIPMAFLFTHWRIRNICTFILYIMGSTFAIALSVFAVYLTIPFRNSKHLRDRYFLLVLYQIHSGFPFPSSIKNSIEKHNCCSWYGPTDFGEIFTHEASRADNDTKFLEDVGLCFGEVKQQDHLTTDLETKSKIPTACGMIYKFAANRICTFIFYMNIVIVVLSILVLILYFLSYISQSTCCSFRGSRTVKENHIKK